MANQVSFLKDLVGQQNPSLSDRLVFTEYEDKSPIRMVMNVAQKIVYVSLFAVIMIDTLSPAVTSPFYPLVHFVIVYRSLILTVIVAFSALMQTVSKKDVFEMYVNDELVFSRIQMGRYPTANEILLAIGCDPLPEDKEKTD